jgi:hypothetical protein
MRQAVEVHKEPVMSVAIEFHGTVASIILSGNIDYSTQDEIGTQTEALSNKQVRKFT